MFDDNLIERLLQDATIHIDYGSTIDRVDSDTAREEEEFSHTVVEETNYPDDISDPITQEPETLCDEKILVDKVRVNTSRFSSAVWFEKMQDQTIVIGGQGGISSWFTFLAAKMFPRSIYTYDPDKVEKVNLAGQLFSMDDVGSFKGDAVANTIARFSDYRSVFTITERFTESSNPAKIMVCGFDNMEARRTFFNSWKSFLAIIPEDERKECLFIDGRLAAESLQILCITGNADWDIKKYEDEYLFSDTEADETVCSLKQTAFVANMIAALMVNMLVNFCANLCGGCRTIPFYTQYEADQMYLNLEGGV